MRSIDGGVEVETDMSHHYQACPKMSILCRLLSFANTVSIPYALVDKVKAGLAKTPAERIYAMSTKERVSSTVPLDWKEVWFTNCPMVSANNVDQELGWCREEYKKIGVEYAYFRHAPENNWYPHYVHNLDNLIRFGGLYPPIHVHADIRKTVLLGATWVYEGGVMQVRARDEIFRVQDLKGKKIGITKSLNTIKNDWWRIQEHMGIINILKLHGMTIDDVEIVEFPYADDWYDDPAMLVPPMNNPSELWLRRDHKHDYAFRPLEKALLDGTVDAIYNQMGQLGQLSEATGTDQGDLRSAPITRTGRCKWPIRRP